MGLYHSRGKSLLSGCVAVGIELIKGSLIHSVLYLSAAPWRCSIIIQMKENALDGSPRRLSDFHNWDECGSQLKSWKPKMPCVISSCGMVHGAVNNECPYRGILVLTRCSVVCLVWLNVKSPMKQLLYRAPSGVPLHETGFWVKIQHQKGFHFWLFEELL